GGAGRARRQRCPLRRTGVPGAAAGTFASSADAVLSMGLSPLLARYDNVVLDLDGCVWVGSACTREAPEAVSALRAGGKRLAFVTNDARRSPEEYVRKLWSLGVQASLEEVVSAGGAIQHVLAERQKGTGAYVIGSPAIFRHVADAGHRILNGNPRAAEADVVVV